MLQAHRSALGTGSAKVTVAASLRMRDSYCCPSAAPIQTWLPIAHNRGGSEILRSTTRPNAIAVDAARDHEAPLDLACPPLGILHVSNIDEACRCRSKWEAHVSYGDCA